MRKRVMSGILAVVCAAMILGTGVSMAPMQEVYAAQENGNNQSQNEDDDGNTTTTNHVFLQTFSYFLFSL